MKAITGLPGHIFGNLVLLFLKLAGLFVETANGAGYVINPKFMQIEMRMFSVATLSANQVIELGDWVYSTPFDHTVSPVAMANNGAAMLGTPLNTKTTLRFQARSTGITTGEVWVTLIAIDPLYVFSKITGGVGLIACYVKYLLGAFACCLMGGVRDGENRGKTVCHWDRLHVEHMHSDAGRYRNQHRLHRDGGRVVRDGAVYTQRNSCDYGDAGGKRDGNNAHRAHRICEWVYMVKLGIYPRWKHGTNTNGGWHRIPRFSPSMEAPGESIYLVATREGVAA
jgi:hypothetical protein